MLNNNNIISEEFDTSLIAEVGIKACFKAARLLITNFKKKIAINECKKHDLKLQLDVECEKIIINEISTHFKDHSILSEENGFIKGNNFLWIIDPLDGSVNYFHGLPHYCISICCYNYHSLSDNNTESIDRFGIPVFGLVYAPVFNELYICKKGQGATLNSQAICVNKTDMLKDAVVALSIGSDNKVIDEIINIINKLSYNVRKIRSYGATALDISWVANGSLDVLIQKNIKPWDFLSAKIILEESGGFLNIIKSDEDNWDIIATNNKLYEDLLRIIN